MTRIVVPIRFKPDEGTGYLKDNGIEIAANSKFYLPPDLDLAQASTILANIGAQPLSALGDPTPCPDNTGADLRRLRFIRANGGSMSVAVSSRTDLLNAATVITGVLNAAGSEVQCIELIGEYFPDVADELGMNYTGDVAVSHVSIGESKQFYYTGQIAYNTDGGTGTNATVFHPIKSITNIENAPATQISTAWSGCVGDFENALACRGKGRRNPRKHRRYELTFATKIDPASTTEPIETETIELPVKSGIAADILTCGQTAAALAGAYCIGYRGESYSRFHKLLAA